MSAASTANTSEDPSVVAWGGSGDGLWGAIDEATGYSRWVSEAGEPTLVVPDDELTQATIRIDTVTVAENRQVAKLRLESGELVVTAGVGSESTRAVTLRLSLVYCMSVWS